MFIVLFSLLFIVGGERLNDRTDVPVVQRRVCAEAANPDSQSRICDPFRGLHQKTLRYGGKYDV